VRNASFVVARDGDRLTVEANIDRPWQVRLVGPQGRVVDARGATVTRSARGTLVVPREGASGLVIVVTD
jgi:hypothetical protein